MLKDTAVANIEAKIGYKFTNRTLLTMAFTHSSYANLHNLESYERLEFLGDSIVGMVVAEILYSNFPHEQEGFLTKVKAKVVSAEALGAKIKSMKIMKYLLTADENVANEVSRSQKMNCNLFEAIVGAILLDSGLDECKKFIISALEDTINQATSNTDTITDYKSRLLEWCAKNGKTAQFNTESGRAKEGGLIFTSKLQVDGRNLGSGTDTSKKRAEQKAAKQAIKKLK
ncbi:MAG: ribonuclease III [Bacillota bacterium]